MINQNLDKGILKTLPFRLGKKQKHQKKIFYKRD